MNTKHKSPPNDQYSRVMPGSFAERVGARARAKMFRLFCETLRPDAGCSILDVGVSSDTTYSATNYFEARWPRKEGIVALGFEDAAFLEQSYPGLRFVRGDARQLPFRSSSFDYVHASAVIEHAGSFDNQTLMVAEALRVAHKAVFLTTPSRWFPIEVHTTLPLVHWMPRPTHRRILRAMGLPSFAEEANLNLMSGSDLRRACLSAGARTVAVIGVRTFGWTSNLAAIARK